MNAIIAEKEKSEVVEFRAPGPGERLRNARVSQDMDIVKAAGKLHLTTDMVDAIECDDYSELPARVFVRGYIRNYARLVDLPVDSIMAQFDELWPEDEHKVKVENAPRLPADPRPGNNWSGGITWLLLIAGLVLFLVWWQGYLDRFSPKDVESLEQELPVAEPSGSTGSSLNLPLPETSDPETQAPALSQGPGLLALPKKPASPATASSAPAVSTVPINKQPVSVSHDNVSTSQLVKTTATGVTGAAPLTSILPQPATLEAQSDVAVAGEPGNTERQITSPAAALQQGVVVRFTEDCWVDIRDSSGSFKLFGTRREGTESLLGGKPPYRFVLGNAAGVNVVVDGEAYDLQVHTRNNVARFTLTP